MHGSEYGDDCHEDGNHLAEWCPDNHGNQNGGEYRNSERRKEDNASGYELCDRFVTTLYHGTSSLEPAVRIFYSAHVIHLLKVHDFIRTFLMAITLQLFSKKSNYLTDIPIAKNRV